MFDWRTYLMTSLSVILVLFELFLAGAVVWGLLHEDRFIAFENRIADRIVAFFRSRRTQRTPEPPKAKMPVKTESEFAWYNSYVA